MRMYKKFRINIVGIRPGTVQACCTAQCSMLKLGKCCTNQEQFSRDDYPRIKVGKLNA